MSEGRVWRPRRPFEYAFLALLLAGAAWCVWGVWHDRRLPGRFERIHLGMDRKAVEAVLGGPDWEGGCGAYVPSLPRADCARELAYASAFAPLVPTYYLVQLDRAGRVVEAEAVRAP
ncbi:MAG TPA: hypothetical protein VF547_05570 [Allosphingosinicella sp.]|jgi:hypothetical protein